MLFAVIDMFPSQLLLVTYR